MVKGAGTGEGEGEGEGLVNDLYASTRTAHGVHMAARAHGGVCTASNFSAEGEGKPRLEGEGQQATGAAAGQRGRARRRVMVELHFPASDPSDYHHICICMRT